MEKLQIIYATLIGPIFLGVLYTSTYLNQKDLPKSTSPFSFRSILLAVGILSISMVFIQLYGKILFNDEPDNILLENYIKSALRIGIIILPILLIFMVLFFEPFMNYLLGKRESQNHVETSADKLKVQDSYRISAPIFDPTNTNPIIIPYEIF